MKTVALLFLFLFTLSAQGQTWSIKVRAHHFERMVGDTTEELITAQDLVYAWRQYKAECAETVKVKNLFSSIRFTEDTTQAVGSFRRWRAYPVNDSVYVPRNRYPTAEEFFEWLERRISCLTK